MKCPKCGTEFQGNFCSNCGLRRKETAKKCPRCGTEYVGKFCSNCGYTDADPQFDESPRVNLRKPQAFAPGWRGTVGKICFAIAGICIVSIVILFMIQPDDEPGITASGGFNPSNTASVLPDAIKVSALDLVTAYDDNEVNAEKLYLDKTLEVTGIINSIGKDIFDDAYVTLGDGTKYSFKTVQCYFNDDQIDRVAQLQPGDTLTVVGANTSGTLGVIMKNCTITSRIVADSSSSASGVTLERFNSIETGMTYAQVCEVFGTEGELISEVDIGGKEYKTQMYSWAGNGSLGANCNCTFQGGALQSKAQFGLE